MFHIANKFYLGYDYAFTNVYPFLVASSEWGDRNFVNIDLSAPLSALTFDALLAAEFDNDREVFWTQMLAKDSKFIAYLDPDTITSLQVQYWRSIFANIPVADIHRLHNAWVDTCKLANVRRPIGTYDTGTSTWSRANAINSLDYKTLEEITVIYNNNPASSVLVALDKNKVSFEYLLADYYYSNTSNYSTEFLNRVELVTWKNWHDEIDHLRYELLSSGIDISFADSSLTPTPGSLITAIEGSSALGWILNPQFGDLDYFKANYDHTKAMAAYQAFADAQDIDYEVNPLTALGTNILAGNWTQILSDDIAKGTGSIFSRELFSNKMSTVFVSWVYQMVRAETTANLSGYQLRQ